MTKEQIKELIKNDDHYAIAAMLAINEFQTWEEQRTEGTLFNNGKGFNGTDAPFFASLIRFYKKRGYLSEKQLGAIKRRIIKYAGQIEEQELQPAKIKLKETKEKKLKKVELINKQLYISFPFDRVLISKVKTLLHRTWDKDKKCWIAPNCKENISKLIEWNFIIPNELIVKQKPTKVITEIPGIKRKLRKHQIEGVNWIEDAKGRTILGDQQGLGKTALGLGWLQLHPEIRPVVVVCPGNAKWTYHSEAKYVMSANDKTWVISGEYRKRNELPKADIYIINYDILHVSETCKHCKGSGKVWSEKKEKDIKCYRCFGKGKIAVVRPDLVKACGTPKAVLVDECQNMQEMSSLRTQAIKRLCKDVPYFLPSSGTKIRHRPKNFFPVLNLTRPDLFPSFFKYAIRYCGAKNNGFGWDYSGASNQEELHNILIENKVLLRRTKKEVMPDLPELTRSIVLLELDPRDLKEYRKAHDDFLGWLKTKNPSKLSKAEKAEGLAKRTALKNLACKFKTKKAIEWIKDFLDADEPLLAFMHHKTLVSKVYETFKDVCVKIDGGCTSEQKRDAETKYQACARCGIKKDKHDIEKSACKEYIPNNTPLFIGTLAAKESLTLTKAWDTVFLELWDSPLDHEQAEERNYGRIGDAHGATAWYLIAKDTIEEDILLIEHEQKRKNIYAIVDGKPIDSVDEFSSLITALLKKENKSCQE